MLPDLLSIMVFSVAIGNSFFHKNMTNPVKQHDVEINVGYVLSGSGFINHDLSTCISLEIHHFISS